ncbi:glutamate synthase (NADH) large subunit [Fibrobacter intestinalis]|uniref:Glutamate synthase [NADPH] large chain n=1 Tax=Fibrobacter intestinalis TaxID=28122 RepID=A0A1M6VZU9_9BACT|nr:glutamate synthase large subunit [Fibrobacter intestinalis]MDD7299351.1 glutamate synthase large subunit [Fibrobacter intestinalis]PBC68682.1 glutamate synthase (NADH) large subunit [Fibrobacter sp. UWS1]SHK87031.1 glutamate synthase (NADH) large subunit [Fibrobacter intestinalis]
MKAQGLYNPQNEHDACGVGFVLNMNGNREHTIVEKGVKVLCNLLHRGATGADVNTGDGAGLLVQIPDNFFKKTLKMKLPALGHYAVGMLFLPQNQEKRESVLDLLEKIAVEENFKVLACRDVPVVASAVGDSARAEMPFIAQVFLQPNQNLTGEDLERALLVLRKRAEHESGLSAEGSDGFYIASLSARTIVYKGMMTAPQVPVFYPDLNDSNFESAVAVVHQRYSTNTFPSWPLAQPFRFMAHNGEINTIRGNRNWMAAREKNLASPLFGENIQKLTPILETGSSDSGNLDNVLELLTLGGREVGHSMMMLMPQAWGKKHAMGPDLRGFFEFHAGIMEPWDGPAAVAFTDGEWVGATLDRNGLRPARYTITKNGFMVFASEAGVLDIPAEDVAEKGSLRPGQMLLVNLETGRFYKDREVKTRFARKEPYRRWVKENHIDIHGFFNAVGEVAVDESSLLKRQMLFGYTREDLDIILNAMASTGVEPIGSMGSDQPLAVLSEKPKLLYWYFKQLFAQVTNPPIDPIREELVMSLMTYLGIHDNILAEEPSQARLVKFRYPVLSNEDLGRLRTLNQDDFKCVTVQMGFPVLSDTLSAGKLLEMALNELCKKVEAFVRSGHKIIILSDKDLPDELSPIPAILAVSAVNQHLSRIGIRTSCGLILETGEAREVMHVASLLGFGATAINPYLAFETIADLSRTHQLDKQVGVTEAIEHYIDAMNKGLKKVMSRMGISTLRSYRNAQVFEIVGLSREVVDKFFTGTASRVGGIGLEEIAKEALMRWRSAIESKSPLLPSGGEYRYRKDGERHLWTPEAISNLQRAVRTGDQKRYDTYAELINDQTVHQSTLRGLFAFKKTNPIPLDEVEPASEIMKRFVTGAMSYGAISNEAHEAIAIAMNRIGAKSNCGEGGEDPERYIPLSNGDSLSSAIKQVASGRFGVTDEYLVNAKELQIKIAQGAKPGEGGQLPGHKVSEQIAKVRHSTPGVTLISPPPHHDIYSIEDIAQLIFDLRNANDKARISVKLVSEVGVGTVAAGVAKARADVILISGYDGGTGASPLSSVKHVGAPWELGLSEAQTTLVLNKLRNRVRLQVDGQMKTGRDVVIGALLGAEEFGFATTILVVLGCVMMRHCHSNTCPVGVATQDPELRKRFKGKPEHIIQYLHFVAEEVRHYMAQLGFRTFDEMVGRSDLLEMNRAIDFWKAKGLDYSGILYQASTKPEEIRCTHSQETGLDGAADYEILKKAETAIETKKPVSLSFSIRNTNRTFGTIVSSRIAQKYGYAGLPDDTVSIHLLGSAGQSFGAFGAHGLTLELEGEANDYVGKGLSGAKIIVRPPKRSSFAPENNVIAGNVILYGATSGEVYLNGCAGERFGIRNSGALAVVEGVGDHACEYMTGGRIVVLGPTGINFGAGMSGGIAYVYDEGGQFDSLCNTDMIDLDPLNAADEKELKTLIENHVKYTGSPKAKRILENWDRECEFFVKVFPMEYRRALEMMNQREHG